MKMEKNKHNHLLTNWLKAGIFALLMLAPLLASVSQMLYATFNKNAYMSTEITEDNYIVEDQYKTNEVNSIDDLIVGRIYHIENYENNANNNNLVMSALYNIYRTGTGYDTTILALTSTIENAYYYTNGSVIQQRDNPTNYTVLYSLSNMTNSSYDFVFISCQSNFDYTMITASEYLGEKIVTLEEEKTLDNAFYYGVQKMTESNLFNWTENTALYTGIKAMTDNLQITTNVIPILITYWTILTIVYVILDIVIKSFTFITHLIVRSD